MAKYVAKQVRAYLYGLLNGNVTHDSAAVQITARASADTTFPYIQIRSTGFVEDAPKDDFGGIYSVDIECVQRYLINDGAQDDVEEIANAVIALLPVRNASATIDNTEKLISSNVVSSITITEEDEQYVYERLILKLECKVYDI